MSRGLTHKQTRRPGELAELQEAGRHVSLTLTRRCQPPQTIEVPVAPGSHWGADHAMRDAFMQATDGQGIAPNAIQARDGIAVAYAARESIRTGMPVQIAPPVLT